MLTDLQRSELADLGMDAKELERALDAGFEPVVSLTPNGRNILLVKGGFAVQPANDNYWLTVKSIDAAMDAFENPQKYR